jgi:hypothetical protein
VAGGRASTYSWFTASASSDSDSEAPAAAAAFAPESASTTKQQTPGSRGERKRSERAEIEEEGRRRRAGREGRAGGRSPLPLATAPFSSSLDFFSGDSDAGGGEAGGGEPSPTAAEGEGGGRFWAGIGTAAGWGRVERRREGRQVGLFLQKNRFFTNAPTSLASHGMGSNDCDRSLQVGWFPPDTIPSYAVEFYASSK